MNSVASRPALTFATFRSTYPATCCRPAETRISGAALNPRTIEPVPAQPSNEGWAQDGCSDFLTINKFSSSDDGLRIFDDGG